MKPDVAVYPGSFDPLTNGHVDLVQRGLKVFPHIVIAVARNINKTTLFTMEERADLIRKTFKDEPRVEAEFFDGLLVDYVRQRGANVVVRGLRAVSDFEYEFQMANMNRRLFPGMETFFMMTGEDHFYVSSQVVREVALLRGNIHGLVPNVVEKSLHAKLGLPRKVEGPA